MNRPPDFAPDHTDVIVIGAGISGIGLGYHLQTLSPDRSYTILEARSALGGTWDLFRYPGVRSDSDMFTLGYSFQPWDGERSITDGDAILRYVRDTAERYGITDKIRYGHRVIRAEWDSATARWTVTAEHDGAAVTLTCSFLSFCSGYYSYRGGHRPQFVGQDDFGGRIVHPQQWPEDLDYAGKRVVIVGSGATAMTLVPAMASTAAHVTMVQRSPTWVVSRPSVDPVAQRLRRFLPNRWAYRMIRAKNVALGSLFYRKTRTDPDRVREMLLGGVRRALGTETTERHFTPTYNPWDQRLCLIPDGDLFEAIGSGNASVVTDTIERFTTDGVAVSSGDVYPADIIVTATGLEMVTLGEVDVVIDGTPLDVAATWTYKGVGYSDVPNLFTTFGFINASWTLRADMIAQFTCRVLNRMRDLGATAVTPRLRPTDVNMTPRPFIADFSSGYMRRMMPFLPKQGDRPPWINTQDVARDRKLLTKEPIDDGVLRFTSADERSVSPLAVGVSV